MEITEYVSLTQGKAAKEASVLLYSPGTDPYFEEQVKNADRVFSFAEGSRAETRVMAKASPRAQRSQITLEAFT